MRVRIIMALAGIIPILAAQLALAADYDHRVVVPFRIQHDPNSLIAEGPVVLQWNNGTGCLYSLGLWQEDKLSTVSYSPEAGDEAAWGSSIWFTMWPDIEPMVAVFYAGDVDFSSLDWKISQLMFCWTYPSCWCPFYKEICIGGETVCIAGHLPPDITLDIVERELRRFFRKRSGRRPLVLPVIMEI